MHTECSPVQPDPKALWQAFSALLTPAAPAGSARSGASSFAPFADLTERFNAAARAYLNGAANASTPAVAEAARGFSESLRELFGDLQLPWNLGAGSAAGGASPLSALHSPALGATRESQLRAQRSAEAWRRVEAAQRRLQRLAADAVREAAVAFATKLTASPPPAASAEALHKLYGAWIDCAEDAYARAAHGEAFCSALAEYVNASSEWRKELQAGIEHSAKLLDLPARSEINSLTQRLRTVESELRGLREQRRAKAKTPTTKAAKPQRARRKAKR
jgi:class III poly(R)-hydroxyalkanoic acid synthase PhaE subunit